MQMYKGYQTASEPGPRPILTGLGSLMSAPMPQQMRHVGRELLTFPVGGGPANRQ